MISAAGIVVGLVTSFLATHVMSVNEIEKIERTLKVQLGVSTVLMTPCLYIIAMWCLPSEFEFAQVVKAGDEGGHVTAM